MATLVRRCRALISSITDDYFQDSDVVDAINDAIQSIISTAIRLEIDQPNKFGRSIKALNRLRIEQEYNDLDFTAFRSFYTADISLDQIAPENLLFVGAIDGSSPIYMTEILQNRRYEMDVGLLRPTTIQGYWYYINHVIPGTQNQEMRTFFSDDAATIGVTVHYIMDPTDIDENSTELGDLPNRLSKAVVLKAALDLANAEERSNAERYLTLYQNELEVNLW